MSTYKKIRERTWKIVCVADPDDCASRTFDITIVVTIALSIAALAIQTVESFYEAIPELFEIIELVSMVIFTIEYALRIWSCTSSESYRRPVLGRIRFAFSALALIDITAIMPFYLPFVGVDLRAIRAVWLFRLFRIAKLGRYSVTLATFRRVITSKKRELLTSLFLLFVLLFVASSLMYFAERDAQPEHFRSIPETLWWAIITISTIGYGDVYPITIAGKIITSLTAIMGIGIAAIPTGIVVSAFWEEMAYRGGDAKAVCPKCGVACEHCTTTAVGPDTHKEKK